MAEKRELTQKQIDDGWRDDLPDGQFFAIYMAGKSAAKFKLQLDGHSVPFRAVKDDIATLQSYIDMLARDNQLMRDHLKTLPKPRLRIKAGSQRVVVHKHRGRPKKIAAFSIDQLEFLLAAE